LSFNFDPYYYPHPSRRFLVYSSKGMVATSQTLAAQAGLETLKKGGNAIDAAVAAAACLTVTEPTSNGIGGDAFAIIWTDGKLHGLNASGPSPAMISRQAVVENGFEEMPSSGWLPVTVPGAPSAWVELSKRWGRLSLLDAFTPAIGYAQQGYPVSPVTAYLWDRALKNYEHFQGEEFKYWFDTFAPGGKAPGAGQVVCLPNHASTLRSIAESEGRSFYQGELAEKIDKYSRQYKGFIRGEDLANYRPFWTDPVSTEYKGYEVFEIPPNGQGLVALMALNMIKMLDKEKKDTEDYHLQVEAMKLAFKRGFEQITDPKKMKTSATELLSDTYARENIALIGDKPASWEEFDGSGGGTVYLAAADGEGNMVSYIQSNYEGFGSGLVVPGTGIALQNRGKEFSLKSDHINSLEPGKLTYHTIIPGFLFKDKRPLGPFGLMGGYMQPQGHVQVILNVADHNLNPQSALDAPRWKWVADKTIEVEHSFPLHLANKLSRLGHNIIYSNDSSSFGRGQLIWKDPDSGVLCGATEPRADGTVAAW